MVYKTVHGIVNRSCTTISTLSFLRDHWATNVGDDAYVKILAAGPDITIVHFDVPGR